MPTNDENVTLSIYHEGIVLEKRHTLVFIHFNEENTDPHYNITKDVNKYISGPALSSIRLPLVIGILKIQHGYLICVSRTSTLISFANLEVNKIEKTVLIPLRFELAHAFFKDWLGKGESQTSRDSKSLEEIRELVLTGAPDSSDDLDLASATTTATTTTVVDANNILFTNIGILTESFKKGPMLGINGYQKMNEPLDHDLFDVYRNDTDVKKMKDSINFDNEMGIDSSNLKHVSHKFMRKILRNVTRYFDKGGFYFSYSVNIVEQFEYKQGLFVPKLTNLKTIDSSFFWNRDLVMEFLQVMDTDDDELLVVPLIQGFIDSIDIDNLIEEKEQHPNNKIAKEPSHEPTNNTNKRFSFDFKNLKSNFVKNNPVEPTLTVQGISAKLLLLSKRSNKRCGVRYLRRGIDDDANVANFVKTTQMLIIENRGVAMSYDIIRGSIPLFFQQDPSKLQPQPTLSRSVGASEKVMLKHYERLFKLYNDITTISLVEKKKREQQLGEEFCNVMVKNNLKFVWFDFHEVCKSMRFDKVRLILDKEIDNDSVKVADQLDLYGWRDNEGMVQNGIFRINCIDCLDRTNIICKYINEQVLLKQLQRLQLVNCDARFNYKFSHIWANNGDCISQQYCSTNAMKGDFTRTNKRNYKGFINDAILSLTRYYYNSITDFFNQFIIDYLLYHNDNDMSFLENFESLMDNFDPNLHNASILQKQLIMANVVNIFDSEIVLGSWWVKTCFELDKFGNAFLDCLLISAKTGLILVYVDVDEKKLEYYHIPNDNVSELQYGHFFTSIVTANDRNPQNNIGLKIGFKNHRKVESEIISVVENDAICISIPETDMKEESETTTKTRFLALKFDKLPYADCQRAIRLISGVCYTAELVKKDLVTFEQAKKSSSVMANIDHQVKKFIWG